MAEERNGLINMTETDCKKCKDYRNCGKFAEFYNYAEIRFCPYQILWVIAHKETFATEWPKDEENPADNNSGQRRVKSEASYVKATLILAEIKKRLQKTDTKGELLISQVEDGRTFNTLSPRAMEELMYVKGVKRKGKSMGFKRWLRDVYYKPR